MLAFLTLGAVSGLALLILLFLFAYAPQRTMTEIIHDAESTR